MGGAGEFGEEPFHALDIERKVDFDRGMARDGGGDAGTHGLQIFRLRGGVGLLQDLHEHAFEACARAVSDLARRGLLAMVEALPYERDEHGGGPGHGVVDDDARQQRREGAEPDADHGRDDRGGRDSGVAQAGAGQPADPPPSLLERGTGGLPPSTVGRTPPGRRRLR